MKSESIRNIFFASMFFFVIAACGGNPSPGDATHVNTNTASDTMTSITNPGVGSVADDTGKLK